MRALPAGSRRIDIIETTPYTTAMTPAAIASHSQLLASIGMLPPRLDVY
jgi:hypothetical protein